MDKHFTFDEKKLIFFMSFLNFFTTPYYLFIKAIKIMFELILSMYYGQMFIGFICGAGIALCANYLLRNNKSEKTMKNV